MKRYDISQEVFGCKVYEGDPAPQREMILRIPEGAVCNLTQFSMCAHNGTHVDAPYHFFDDGKTVDGLSLEALIGECRVFAAQGDVSAAQARAFLKETGEKEAGKRILLKGDAVVTEEAAAVFAAAGVLLLGNESQTVGPEDAPAKVHRILLGAGVVLLEGIRLGEVPEGEYLLCAAPEL